MDSLHGDLLGGGCGGGRGGARGGDRKATGKKPYARHRSSGPSRPPPPGDSLVQPDKTFAQALSPPEVNQNNASDGDAGWTKVLHRKSKYSPDRLLESQNSASIGTKRQRSPATCGHCLRSTHKTDECRHLLTCRRCGGSGHVSSACRVEVSPRNRRARPAAKGRRPPDNLIEHSYERPPVDRLHPRKTQISLSLTHETSKLRKELSKVIVLEVVSGQTNEEILLEFLPGALNTPRVEAVYEFRGNSYLASLCSEAEAIRASKIGELSLPSRMGPCVFSIAPWSPEIGSIGAASGKGQVLLIWNLPLHAWTWSVLVDLLRPIGDLVAIPQPSKPHKAFLSVLVRCRHRTALPFEISLSFGMRSFTVLITDNKLPFPTFRRDQEKFVYSSATLAVEEDSHVNRQPRFTHEVPLDSKGKQVESQRPGTGSGTQPIITCRVEGPRTGGTREWRPRSRAVASTAGEKDSVDGNLTAPSDAHRTGTSLEARPVSSAPGVSPAAPTTRPVSIAPGVVTDRRKSTRPVSDAPGVLITTMNSTDDGESATVDRRDYTRSLDLDTPRTVGLLPVDTEGHHGYLLGGSLSHDAKKHTNHVPVVVPGEAEVVARLDAPDCNLHDSNMASTNAVASCGSERIQSLNETNSSHGRPPLDQASVGMPMLGRVAGPTITNLNSDDLLNKGQEFGPPCKDLTREGPPELDPFCDPSNPPLEPSLPPNFDWVFLRGIWTIVPTKFCSNVTSMAAQVQGDVPAPNDNVEIWDGDDQEEDLLQETGDGLDDIDVEHDDVSSGNQQSGDSESDFEVKIKRLLLSGQVEDCSQGTRRSERMKKPSSKWTEEAGFIAQPPRSARKKGTSTSPPEAPDAKRIKVEEPMRKIKRSLEFLSTRDSAVPNETPSLPRDS